MKLTRLACYLFLSFVLPISIFATDYYVATSGSDANSGLVGFPKKTIAAAITAASNGDKIFVAAGTYTQLIPLDISKQLDIRGAQYGVDPRPYALSSRVPGGGAESIIEGNRNLSLVNITSGSVSIDGFHIRHNSPPPGGVGDMVTTPATPLLSGLVVSNNILSNGADENIQIRGFSDVTIKNNYSFGSTGDGINISDNLTSTNLNILDNEIATSTSDHGAIYCYAVSNLKISGNVISSSNNGIRLSNSSANNQVKNVIVENNNITGVFNASNSTRGIGIQGDASNNISVRYNNIAQSGGVPNSLFVPVNVYNNVTNVSVQFNNLVSNGSSYMRLGNDAGIAGPATPVDALCNWWGDLSGPLVASNIGGSGGQITGNGTALYANWLNYGNDASSSLVGLQLPTSITAISNGDLAPAINDYRLLSNAVGCAVSGQTLNLSGSYSFTDPYAAAAWPLGNDGKVGTTADNYTILAPSVLNNFTITSPSSASISGPGDLAAANLESFLLFNNNSATSSYKNLTIEKMDISGFDVSIFMDTDGGNTTAFDGLKVKNNTITIPADLNATVAPIDVNQNIGIHYTFGANQEFSGNTFMVAGDGISDDANSKVSTSIVMQSNTSGGSTVYNGLKIKNNIITVTGLPNAQPAVIRGIWENSASTDADIQITGNKFTNANPLNLASNNRQYAMWVTSFSGVNNNLLYKNNEVSGFNSGISTIGGPFTSYGPSSYNTGALPALLENNTFDANKFSVVVRKASTSTNTGSPFIVRNNSFTNTASGGFAISNETPVLPAVSGTTDAPCNWFGTATYLAVAPLINGAVAYNTILDDGGDGSGATGFQPTGTCIVPPVHNVTKDLYYTLIQPAVNGANNGDVITVSSGSYNEQVLVNKSVTINGIGATQPIVDFTGSVTGKPTLFDVSVDGVTIDNINFKVDLSKLRSAVIASGASIDEITVTGNLIDAYGTPAGIYGDRNAVSVNYGGNTNYRIATGGVNNITFTGNTVNGTGPASYFRSGISADEAGGTFSGNTLQTINHDVLVRFGSNGPITISSNNFNGGGVELSDQNAAAGTITLSSNTFTGVGAPATAMLRIRNNYNSIPHVISANTFNGYEWAMSIENMNSITLDANIFNTLSTTAHAVAINTKSISSNSNTIVQVPVGATMTNNNFNGSGNALSFLNHDNDNASYGTFTIGTAGNENNFASTLSTMIVFDGQTGTSTGSTFPLYPGTGGWPTTMACWNQNINIQNNKMDVGMGLQLPVSMNFAQRTTLENKLTHKPDNSCLGLITYFAPVHNLNQNTYYTTIQAGINAANVNDVIECAEWIFNERVTIDKSLTLQGIDSATTIITGSGLAGNGNGITINNGVTGVTIQKLTVTNFAGASGNANAGIYAIGGNNSLLVDMVGIVNNVGGSGFYANGPVNGVTVTHVTSTGHTIGARGIVIWNGLKENINISDNHVYGNNCCGIELQDGSGTGVTMNNNNVHDNGDNGIGVTGLTGPGANTVSNNTLVNNGRFGIEIKNPNGSGSNSGAGSVVVDGNSVSRTNPIGAELRDIAGIAVIRRGVLAGNVDVPYGVQVNNNSVSGYTQPSTSEGFGIVLEGINHTVSGNTLNGNDVGIQRQAGNLPYPGDGDQSNKVDTYFGRGNSPVSCGITISGSIFASNGVDTRDVGSSTGTGIVVNTTTGKSFCTIQAAINDAGTVNGHTITVSSGSYNEQVLVNKSVTIRGAGSTTILTPLSSCTGNGITVSADGVVVKSLKLTNYNYGVVVGANMVLLDSIESLSNCIAGIELSNGINGLTLKNSKINSNTVVGIRAGTAAQMSGITIDSCEVKGNQQGMFIAASSGGSNSFNNIAIRNSDFSNNTKKGMYFEKLSNAVIEKVVMNNSGTDVSYDNNAGIDINLKYGSYSNITIQNNDITNCGAMGTATDPQNTSAIAIKGRDDAPSYSTKPATLNTVLIKNNTITGPQNGIRLGEIGKINSTPSNVTIEGNDLSFAFANKAIVSRVNSDITLVCNWHGTTDLAAIQATFTNAGTSNIILSTALGTGGDASPSVGFQPSGSCTCPSGNQVTNTNTSMTFCTIQAAINDPTTENGHTLVVSAGTYIENITVTKSLTILGPNAAIAACSGSRNPEAIVVPATAAISTGEIFHVAASNVTISGFTIDGDNTALNSGFTSINGADIDAAEGITVYEDNVNNLTVTNNIIKNLSYFGVSVYGGYDNIPPNYPAHGIPSSGHNITNNKIQDMGTYDAGSGIDRWGGGVLLYHNQYAAVTNNCMDNVRIGVQTGNFSQANPGGNTAYQLIDGNTMTNVRRTGIFHNLAYSNASAYTVSNNSITGGANANEPKWDGVELASMSVPSTASGNIINAGTVTVPSSGIEVWNVKSTVPAAIIGGSVTGTSIGVFVNNYDGYSSDASDGAHATITGITITPSSSGTGIKLLDNTLSTHANVQASIGAGVVITNGTNGLVVENASASVTALGNVAFNSQSGDYIKLINNANNLNATTATFDGPTGALATLPQNFGIEDKISHKIDLLPLGFVLVKAGEDFVTPNSYVSPNTTPLVQRGVDAASNGFIVNVAAGSYAENVVVNKEVTILGAQAGQNVNTRFGSFTGSKANPMVESVVTAPTNNPTSGNPNANDLFRVIANNVTIDGFTMDGNNPALPTSLLLDDNSLSIHARRGITNIDATDNFNPINNLTVKNNIIQNVAQRGVSLANNGPVSTGNLINANLFRNFGWDPVNGGQAVILFTNAYADITNNTIDVPHDQIGLHLQNFSSNGTMNWIGNTVTVGQNAIGIHANLFYAPAGILNIGTNTVNAGTGVTGGSDFTWGINAWSVQSGSTVNITNNIVGNSGGTFARGINLWNLPTTNNVTVSGGTVGSSIVGVNLDNIDPYYGAGSSTTANLSNVSISNTQIGVRARAAALVIAPSYGSNTVAGDAILKLDNVIINQTGATTGVLVNAPVASGSYIAKVDFNSGNTVSGGLQEPVMIDGENSVITTTGIAITVPSSGAHDAIQFRNFNAYSLVNLGIDGGLAVNLNANTAARAFSLPLYATARVNANWTVPTPVSGGLQPVLINGSLRFNSGILSSGNSNIEFGTTADDIMTGSAPEKNTSYLLGNAKMLARPVNNGSLDMIGVRLAAQSGAGANVGNMDILRTTSTSGSISPIFPGNASIRTVWTINPSNTSSSRTDVQYRYLSLPSNLNGQDPSSIYTYRFVGGSWTKVSASLLSTLSGDIYTTPSFGVPGFSPWTLSSDPAFSVPDLTPRITVNPNNIVGPNTIEITVQINELLNVNTDGSVITLYVDKNADFSNFSFNSGQTTNLTGQSVQNSVFSIDETSDPDYYIIKTTVVFKNSSRRVAFKVDYDPGVSVGVTPVNVFLLNGSGGKINFNNNNSSTSIVFSF